MVTVHTLRDTPQQPHLDFYLDSAACGKFAPSESHEAAVQDLPPSEQDRMNRLGLKRCNNCWCFQRAHKSQPDEAIKGWLHYDWLPEEKDVNLDHFGQDHFSEQLLDGLGIPGSDHSDVFEIGCVLYERFSKEDVPVPSKRLIPPENYETIIKCFEAFYNRLFNDPQMQGLFAIGEDGFGRDLGFKEHGRRLGLFCLWRMCGDKEYVNYRSKPKAECPYQVDLYHKLAPGHIGAKKAGGLPYHDRFAFTVKQSRRWLGHQWCAFKENASEAICKAVVSWLASIIDLYGPFVDCDAPLQEPMSRCPFSGLVVSSGQASVCPFPQASASASASGSASASLFATELTEKQCEGLLIFADGAIAAGQYQMAAEAAERVVEFRNARSAYPEAGFSTAIDTKIKETYAKLGRPIPALKRMILVD